MNTHLSHALCCRGRDLRSRGGALQLQRNPTVRGRLRVLGPALDRLPSPAVAPPNPQPNSAVDVAVLCVRPPASIETPGPTQSGSVQLVPSDVLTLSSSSRYNPESHRRSLDRCLGRRIEPLPLAAGGKNVGLLSRLFGRKPQSEPRWSIVRAVNDATAEAAVIRIRTDRPSEPGHLRTAIEISWAYRSESPFPQSAENQHMFAFEEAIDELTSENGIQSWFKSALVTA